MGPNVVLFTNQKRNPRQNPLMQESSPSIAATPDGPLMAAAAELVPLFYADLKRLARRVRSGIRDADTLQTTALIHEAYLKLRLTSSWNDRPHFLRAAALAMRQVLVDDARSRLALCRGQGVRPLPLDAADGVAAEAPDERLMVIDEALSKLAVFSPRLAHIVECRYFAGYTEPETAEALGIAVSTVQRDWVKARSWLHMYLGPD